MSLITYDVRHLISRQSYSCVLNVDFDFRIKYSALRHLVIHNATVSPYHVPPNSSPFLMQCNPSNMLCYASSTFDQERLERTPAAPGPSSHDPTCHSIADNSQTKRPQRNEHVVYYTRLKAGNSYISTFLPITWPWQIRNSLGEHQ